MTLRRRLTLWYGAGLAVVLTLALWLAYDLHAEAHDSDVDSALNDLVNRTHAEVDAQVASGIPLAAIDLSAIRRGIDEPHAVWFVAKDGTTVGAGMTSDAAFIDAAVTELPAGSYTQWTVDGRVRSDVVDIGIGRVVAAADLSVIDVANADLRTAYAALGIIAVALGTAVFSSVVGIALRPVSTLMGTASEIAESRDFKRRVAIAGDTNDELVALAMTFDEMLGSLEAAYRQQQRFLGDVSHELRTPLTTIRGHAELLASGDAPAAEQRAALERIARESARVSRLVDELLVLARAEAAEPFSPRAVSLDETVMEAFGEMRIVAGGRLRVRSIQPAVVGGEPDRLKQLIIALLDNAIRYTPEPGTVDVSVIAEGRDAVLRVQDEGIGIDDADLPHVFERFYRGAAAKRANGSGSGLGLAIVKWIVDRHGGSIDLARREGRGTTVTVRLPLLVSAAADETHRVGVQPLHA